MIPRADTSQLQVFRYRPTPSPLPEPPASGLDPATEVIETVAVIVAKLYDLVALGLMVEVMAEDDARLVALWNLLCVQEDYLEQAQTLLDQWDPPSGTATDGPAVRTAEEDGR
jgi:hypothetical protein